jgi:hypothetical protein
MTADENQYNQNSDYLEDIFWISISLAEVSSVIVGPPPLSV